MDHLEKSNFIIAMMVKVHDLALKMLREEDTGQRQHSLHSQWEAACLKHRAPNKTHSDEILARLSSKSRGAFYNNGTSVSILACRVLKIGHCAF